jgi:hypothetical protein
MKVPVNDNEDDYSPGKIVLFENLNGDFYKFIYGYGSQREDRSPEALIQAIQEAAKEARSKGYEGLEMHVMYEEGDRDNLPHGYLRMQGKRRETDAEFKRRQEWIRGRLETERKNKLRQFEQLSKEHELGLLTKPTPLVRKPARVEILDEEDGED